MSDTQKLNDIYLYIKEIDKKVDAMLTYINKTDNQVPRDIDWEKVKDNIHKTCI
jgi:hypothetical protein